MTTHTAGPSIIHTDHHGEDGQDAITITWEDRSGRVPVRSLKTYKGSLIAAAPDMKQTLLESARQIQLVRDGKIDAATALDRIGSVVGPALAKAGA